MKSNICVFFLFSMLLLSTNSLLSQWVQTNLPESTYTYCVANSGSTIYAGTYHFFLTTDHGNHWQALDSGLAGYGVSSIAIADYGIIAGTINGIFISQSGSDWTRVDSGKATGTVVSLATSGPNIFAGMYGGFGRSGILLSTDDGLSWRKADSGLTDENVRTIIISDSNIFVGTNFSGVYRSTDNGNSWQKTSLGSYDVRSIAVTGSRVLAATNDGIFRSTDNGISWQVADSAVPGLANQYVLALAVSGSNVLAGRSGFGENIYLSTNNGTDWRVINTGVEILNISDILIADSNIFVAGTGGVWRGSLSEVLSAADEPSPVFPKRFTLDQNYPNPFNPTTTIRFSITQAGHISLRVYNVLGEEVETLVSKHMPAGQYRITWNASLIKSGVYFYRLDADMFSETRKLLLLR